MTHRLRAAAVLVASPANACPALAACGSDS